MKLSAIQGTSTSKEKLVVSHHKEPNPTHLTIWVPPLQHYKDDLHPPERTLIEHVFHSLKEVSSVITRLVIVTTSPLVSGVLPNHRTYPHQLVLLMSHKVLPFLVRPGPGVSRPRHRPSPCPRKTNKSCWFINDPPPPATAPTCQLFGIFNQPAVIAVIGACLTAFRNLTRSLQIPPRISRG